jgi:hypothetical protein
MTDYGLLYAAGRERVSALVEEWAEGSPQFEDGLRAIGPPLAGVAISDAEPYLPLLSAYGIAPEPLGER